MNETDRVGLLQGVLRAICICVVASSAVAASYPFEDGFEVGLLNWSPSGTWSTTPVVAYSGLLSATDSHGAFYPNNMDASLTLASGMDLSSAVRPALAFHHRYSIEANYDFGSVETFRPPSSARASDGRL